MQTLDRDEVSVVVAADPAAVYALVSDVTRTPEFSPEVTAVRWLDGATGPAVGARFEAVNTSGNAARHSASCCSSQARIGPTRHAAIPSIAASRENSSGLASGVRSWS